MPVLPTTGNASSEESIHRYILNRIANSNRRYNVKVTELY